MECQIKYDPQVFFKMLITSPYMQAQTWCRVWTCDDHSKIAVILQPQQTCCDYLQLIKKERRTSVDWNLSTPKSNSLEWKRTQDPHQPKYKSEVSLLTHKSTCWFSTCSSDLGCRKHAIQQHSSYKTFSEHHLCFCEGWNCW